MTKKIQVKMTNSLVHIILDTYYPELDVMDMDVMAIEKETALILLNQLNELLKENNHD